jgi:hypothetical protein
MTPQFIRLPDWQLRLESFVTQRQSVPFVWGANDCALFAADAVQAITGRDPAPHLRGHRNARQAICAVREHGGLGAIAWAALGPSMPVLRASVGDVVLVRVGKRLALGVCNCATVLGPGPLGVVAVPMADAVLAWGVR